MTAYITGYTDKISVKPGDELNFMLSAEGVDSADACLVRLIHGDENPKGPGFIERELPEKMPDAIALRTQQTQAGNHIDVPGFNVFSCGQESLSIHMLVYPTLHNDSRQVLFSQWDSDSEQGLLLEMIDGIVHCRFDQQTVALNERLQCRTWYQLLLTIDSDKRCLRLQAEPLANSTNGLLSAIVVEQRVYEGECAFTDIACATVVPFLFGGVREAGLVKHHFNGKLDRCGVQRGVKTLADIATLHQAGIDAGTVTYWDTSIGLSATGVGDRIVDRGPDSLHAYGFNRPVRGMTGYNWEGQVDCYTQAPHQFGGIHLHQEAIIDCRWDSSLQWTVPVDLASGVYALRLRNGELEDHVVFFVRPKNPTAKVCMLMPTASYLAYANEHFVLHGPSVEAITAHPLILSDADFLLAEHPEWGLSSYDHHADGAGVCYTSYRRPVMGMRPKARMAATGVPWQFAADLSIVYWLESQGIAYDVMTDEDLHYEELAAIAPYDLVINGTHSEYYSRAMMDATEQYLAQGGNVFYTGANGYYWAVAFRDDEPWCMEIRKLDTGTRAWQAEPGEFYMATDGEKGGIWRARGRPPQKMMGVGFTSEGMDECKPYRRMPDSYAPEMAWLFKGVDDEVIGDFGLALDGAAGLELDRYERTLGTPPNAWLLASSEGHSDNYPHVSEEIGFNFPGLGGTQDPQIRADLCFFETASGGSVLATGSIAWGQALPCFNGENNVSAISRNYVDYCVGEK